MIPAGHRVLDVGCGDGCIDAALKQRRDDLHIEGVDVLVRPTALIPVQPFDGQRLPFADSSWDTVMMSDVLHHTHDAVALLREAARVATPLVLVKDHVREGLLAGATLRVMDYVGNAPHGVALPYNYLSNDQWESAFTAAGLRVSALRRRLGLYPLWADPIFGRGLHLVAALTPVRTANPDTPVPWCP
jgi:SAM-dependent methyltransferase